MKPLISIIIPVYNTALYLEEIIQSVLNQTVENWDRNHHIFLKIYHYA